MARPREFDIEEMLTKVLDVFWENGYESTSLSDLMNATGLAKASLYKGYGNKKNLFMRSLDSYLLKANANLSDIASTSSSGRHALEQIFAQVVKMSTTSDFRKGCFSVNSTIELAPHDPEINERLNLNTQQKEKTIKDIVERGISDGSLRKSLHPERTARYITTIMNGLQVKGKLGLTQLEANETVAMLMDSMI